MKRTIAASALTLLSVGFAISADVPVSDPLESLDPGPRGGAPGAGGPIAGLIPQQVQFFANGQGQFIEEEGVALTGPGNGGLGPTFNSDSCVSCHSQPFTGGSSPSVNPQFTVGQIANGLNKVPFFVLQNGPVREVRMKGTNAVQDLFTIRGRTDTPGANTCTLQQPDFQQEFDRGEISFRIPIPLFGDGLMEAITDDTLEANVAASASNELGIHGELNRSGNDFDTTRFGWKAQNKSILMFAGEAYNVEMGITNELMPNERGYPPHRVPTNCLLNPTPEDRTVFESTDPTMSVSDVQSFDDFIRFLDQPTPACTGTGCSPQIQAGLAKFVQIGCANCHTPSLTTDISEEATGLNQVQVNLFSDLALHHMGEKLADGIVQGNAGPDQFRTAPLWGIGQRTFFLHDGRTNNLGTAIEDHASNGSEANQVISNFNKLSRKDQQNLILFLRSR